MCNGIMLRGVIRRVALPNARTTKHRVGYDVSKTWQDAAGERVWKGSVDTVVTDYAGRIQLVMQRNNHLDHALMEPLSVRGYVQERSTTTSRTRAVPRAWLHLS